MSTKQQQEQKPEQEHALAKMPEMENGQRGLLLRSFEDMWRFAECASQSGLAPKGMESPSAVLIAIQMGAEVGLSPMASLENIAVINGRPSLFGDAPLAVCRSSGLFVESAFHESITQIGEATMTAVCRVQRKGGNVCERKFSVVDAQVAQLWGKQGPWKQYPRRMLQRRARSWALRDAFTDVLKGLHVNDPDDDIKPARHVESVVADVEQSADRSDALAAKLKENADKKKRAKRTTTNDEPKTPAPEPTQKTESDGPDETFEFPSLTDHEEAPVAGVGGA